MCVCVAFRLLIQKRFYNSGAGGGDGAKKGGERHLFLMSSIVAIYQQFAPRM